MGGNHWSSLEKVKEMMSTYEGFDRARNQHRYSLEERPVIRVARRNFQQPRHTMNYYQQQPHRYYQSQPNYQNNYQKNSNGQWAPTSAKRNWWRRRWVEYGLLGRVGLQINYCTMMNFYKITTQEYKRNYVLSDILAKGCRSAERQIRRI